MDFREKARRQFHLRWKLPRAYISIRKAEAELNCRPSTINFLTSSAGSGICSQRCCRLHSLDSPCVRTLSAPGYIATPTHLTALMRFFDGDKGPIADTESECETIAEAPKFYSNLNFKCLVKNRLKSTQFRNILQHIIESEILDSFQNRNEREEWRSTTWLFSSLPNNF